MTILNFFKQSKRIFLLDGIGALVTAVMVGFVLPQFQEQIGLQNYVLYILSGIAVVYGLYSFICFFVLVKNQRLFLRIIAVLNLMYCGITALLLLINADQIKQLGIIYFLAEIGIILVLVYLELTIARKFVLIAND